MIMDAQTLAMIIVAAFFGICAVIGLIAARRVDQKPSK
jgi:hypothetical protein